MIQFLNLNHWLERNHSLQSSFKLKKLHSKIFQIFPSLSPDQKDNREEK